jgi:4-amino-4-deoxy-L-arabinose transferase-like glycosyltransferase
MLTAILLLAALMRFPALDRVPPGWRDDELIEFDMDWRIAQGWRPLYIREAEGHEPLYHYLHAGTLWLFGLNSFGYRWLPAAFGTLSTALLVSLAWRLFRLRVAALTGALYAVGLWPVLYSRFGVRHIGVMPFILLALYALDRIIRPRTTDRRPQTVKFSMLAGIAMGLGLYVYYAAWVMPVLTLVFGLYLFVLHRPRFKRAWPGLLAALVVAGVIFLPLGWDLAHGPRVTRIEVTGAPVRALLQGDPRPALETTLGTLGMFTFKGDPEWLYNFSGLPVFDWLAGMAFYLGVLVCLVRLRDARYGLALTWLVVGLAPAFISVPPGSYSHTFAAQGAVYLLPALALVEISNFKFQISNRKWAKNLLKFEILYLIFIAWVGWYTCHYYFDWWPAHSMVRFAYHADTRDLARWLDAQAEGSDVAISTTGTQLAPQPRPLEPFALSLDLRRTDVAARWFDGAWALVWPSGGGSRIALLSFPHLNPLLEPLLPAQIAEYHNPPTNQLVFRVYQDAAAPGSRGTAPADAPRFGDRLTLVNASLAAAPPRDGGDGFLLTTWRVDGTLTDPLQLFAHLLDANGQMLGGDDRLDVLVTTLRPGDVFVQINRLPRPAGADCSPCRVEIGLYHPATGERLRTPTADYVVLPIEVRP